MLIPPITATTIDPNVQTLNMAIVLNVERDAQVAAARRSRPAGHVNHAPHSEAWWRAVSVCEQGGRNDEFFGYFSYMDGSAGGGKSWDEQVTMGNATIAHYGDKAWAAKCVAAGYNAAPGG